MQANLSPEQERERGSRARELLANEMLQQALAAIEAEVIAQWEACPARDREGKEALWQLFKTTKKFRNLLSGYVETGKLATENLKRYEDQGLLRRVFRAA